MDEYSQVHLNWVGLGHAGKGTGPKPVMDPSSS